MYIGTLLCTYLHNPSGKSGQNLFIFSPRGRKITKNFVMLIFTSDEWSNGWSLYGNFPKYLPVIRAMTGSALARFNFLISSSEYPFFAIAASLACCNSSSKRFWQPRTYNHGTGDRACRKVRKSSSSSSPYSQPFSSISFRYSSKASG